jgi:tRNA pseudouridine38-40 synthase
MSRYFIEVFYKGTQYAGFQVQHNAVTVQGEVERALGVFFRKEVGLTGSSRTDAGVHARQNYFHMDLEDEFEQRWVYNINSLLPVDIAVRRVVKVGDGAHCRFDALWREYSYLVYREKDPFVREFGYYFPYTMDIGAMRAAAEVVKKHGMFEAFSKRNTQVKTYLCSIMESVWEDGEGRIVYRVRSNRFLRGMVRGLVGTMLQVGRGKMGVDEFGKIIAGRDSSAVDFSVPGSGLCLEWVEYGDVYFG